MFVTKRKPLSRTTPEVVGEKWAQSISCATSDDLPGKDLQSQYKHLFGFRRSIHWFAGRLFLLVAVEAVKKALLWAAEQQFTCSSYLRLSASIWLSGKVSSCVRSVCCWHLDAPSQQMASSARSHRAVQHHATCENTTRCDTIVTSATSERTFLKGLNSMTWMVLTVSRKGNGSKCSWIKS